MSLLKSPTLTPALLAAKRRSAQKSTGPRTPWGKAQSRMNGLRHGGRSPVYRRLLTARGNAPPGGLNHVTGSILPPELRRHRALAELVEVARWAESAVAAWYRTQRGDERPAGATSRANSPSGAALPTAPAKARKGAISGWEGRAKKIK